jgi:hypothetical protein
MRFYGEMRVQGSGPLDGARFDALAYALAEIEETDPAVDEVDLTASLAQGWITASMVIDQETLELAVAKLMATVRTAIYPNGDTLGGWKFLTETAGLSVQPAAARAAGAGAFGPGASGPGASGPGASGPSGSGPSGSGPSGSGPSGSGPGPTGPGSPAPGLSGPGELAVGRGTDGRAADGRAADGRAEGRAQVPQPS